MPVIASATFETGDLSDFDAVQDTNGNLSATVGAAAAGTLYGLDVGLDGTNAGRRGYIVFASPVSGIWRAGFYINPGGVTGPTLGNGRVTGILLGNFELEFSLEGGPGAVGTANEFELYVAATGASVQRLVTTDGWHTVEVRIDTIAGDVRVWLDKLSTDPPDMTILTTIPAIALVYVGSGGGITYLNGVSYYVDEVTVRDDDVPIFTGNGAGPYERADIVIADHVPGGHQ